MSAIAALFIYTAKHARRARRLFYVGLGMLLIAGLAPAQAQAGEGRPALTLDAFSIVKVHTRVVDNARSIATLGPERDGTGIVIDSNGLILTIGYLIQEAESVDVTSADGTTSSASVIAQDSSSGLGLLRAVKTPAVPPIAFGESNKVSTNEPVLIVGFDGVAPAYVVSRRAFTGYWEYLLDEAIYTAPATVNWQGAALINREGKLLGVGSLVVGDALGGRPQVPGNLFVPIDLLKPILGELIAQGKVATKPRPWLGVNTQDLQGKLIVTRVSSDSPAQKAGLVAGDIIVGVGGVPLTSQADFYRKMWGSGDAGVEVILDVLKGTEVKKIGVKSIDRDNYLRGKPVY